MHPLDVAVATIAAAQYSVIAVSQALGVGTTHTMVHDRWRAGSWIRMRHGVYRLARATRSWEQMAMAAVLWAGPNAVVSSRAAAYLWRLEGFASPGIVEITVPRGTRLRHAHGILVHETKAWHLVGRTTRFGVPVTGIARTILDLCAWVREYEAGLRALDDARRRGLVGWPELWECLIRHACRGRNGIGLFRRVLVRRHGRKPPGGYFARLVLLAMDECGLPEPECEYEVRVDGHRYFIDLAYPHLMLGIELDDSSHLTEKALEEDPIRQARLESAGWTIVRYSWREFMEAPSRVIADVQRVLASMASHTD